MKKLIIIILFVVLLIFSLPFAYCFKIYGVTNTMLKIQNRFSLVFKRNLSYKSIRPIEISKYDLANNYSFGSEETLIRIHFLDTDIQDYLSDSSHSYSDRKTVYNLYLENLYYYAKFLSPIDFDDWRYSNQYEYHYSYLKPKNSVIILHVPIYKERCDSIIMIQTSDKYYIPQINANFQYNLASYLDDTLKKYWSIRKKEQMQLYNWDYRIYNRASQKPTTLDEIAYFILLWTNFQKENKDEDLAFDVKHRLYKYIYYFLNPPPFDYTDWSTEDRYDCEYDQKCGNPYFGRPLSKSGQMEFEKLLISLDKDTETYEIIQNAYNVLKNNDFKTSDEYYKSFDIVYKYLSPKYLYPDRYRYRSD